MHGIKKQKKLMSMTWERKGRNYMDVWRRIRRSNGRLSACIGVNWLHIFLNKF